MKGDVYLDSVHLIWDDVLVWTLTVCIFIFMKLSSFWYIQFLHTSFRFPTLIWFANLLFCAVLRRTQCAHKDGFGCGFLLVLCCYSAEVNSTPRFDLVWEFYNKKKVWPRFEVNYYKGEPDHAAAFYHISVYYMPMALNRNSRCMPSITFLCTTWLWH